MYDVLFIPMRVFDPPDNGVLNALSWVTQLFWNFDIVSSFFTGYYTEGELVMQPRRIACHYLKTWFAFDAFVVATDWFIFSLDQKEDNSSAGVARVVKGIRFW